MAKITIKIELEDINCLKLGDCIEVKCENGICLIFTPKAVEQLIIDYQILFGEKLIKS